jgi:UDP-N-acetylglucosamine--N-acetylmuramyl-(pentapeptide) pyrophosphoryl-undecaprenol N-acetylglucosamine transferase
VTPVRVLIAGGGTGGHLYPGIAIAEEVTARPGGEILFVGTARGLETRLVPAAGFSLELLDVSGLKRTGLMAMLKGLFKLPRAFLASRAILQRYRPDLVIGVGGYASGPMVLTAALTGYPTAIQEQNSHPGFTNRVLGRFVRRVFVAFEEARRHFDGAKTELVGNPVRRRFFTARGGPGSDGGAQTGAGAGAGGQVLVVGGSQGARAVNDLLIPAAQVLSQRGALPRILHQTGPADEARIRDKYQALGLGERVEVRPFIDDMPAELAQSRLVVARAGALTLAELAITGCPAILIPLPTAADDHQTRNAAEFQRAGAALVMPQASATAVALADKISELLGDETTRARMAAAMATLGRPDAARQIVDKLEQMAAAAGHVS